jgi:hypothetical protein
MVIDQSDRVDRSSLGQGIVEDLPQVIVLLGLSSLFEVGLETRVKAGELGTKTLEVSDERVDRVFPELSDAERFGSARVSSSDVLDKVGDERSLGVSWTAGLSRAKLARGKARIPDRQR